MREPRIAAEIAKQLHKFHQLDIPGSKEPQLWNDVFKFLKKGTLLTCFRHFILGLAALFHQHLYLLKKRRQIHIRRMTLHNIVCREILIAASVLKFEDAEMQKRYETISFREIKDEVKELKVLCGGSRITVMRY